MHELFAKEGQSIFTFKKGDIIIKVKPSTIKDIRFNENLGVSIEVVTGIDNSFRYPIEFVCIENNKIYLRDVKEDNFFKKKYVRAVNLEDYSEGWALFIIPDGLTLDECI